MKLVTAVLVALLLSSCATPAVDPAATVRLVTDANGGQCSAVVIAPDYALTARHCLDAPISVGGLPAEYSTSPLAPAGDIAMIYVPGLQCPCAPLGERPNAGDEFKTIGFPVADGTTQRVTVGTVAQVTTIAQFAPWVQAGEFALGTFVFSTENVLSGGHSGGGMFVRQEGVWRLVAINVFSLYSKDRTAEVASGFTPLDVAANFL